MYRIGMYTPSKKFQEIKTLKFIALIIITNTYLNKIKTKDNILGIPRIYINT